jgi:hypothetical protein
MLGQHIKGTSGISKPGVHQMRHFVPIAAALFLAACGDDGRGDVVLSSDPAPAPAEATAKTTRMACTDVEKKLPPWWAEVTIDPAEFPWRTMDVTTERGPVFVMDPQGDIVKGRGIAASPPGSKNQSNYVVQVYQEGNDAILVWIASNLTPQLDLFKFRIDGTMIELGQSAEGSRPGTICTPAALGE